VFDWEATHALNARVVARGAPTREAVRKELHKGATRILALLERWATTTYAGWP